MLIKKKKIKSLETAPELTCNLNRAERLLEQGRGQHSSALTGCLPTAVAPICHSSLSTLITCPGITEFLAPEGTLYSFSAQVGNWKQENQAASQPEWGREDRSTPVWSLSSTIIFAIISALVSPLSGKGNFTSFFFSSLLYPFLSFTSFVFVLLLKQDLAM